MKVLCFIGGVNMLILTCENGIGPLVGFIKSALTLVQIFIPIALIIWGTIDLGKAVIASDEKAIKSNQQILVKRAISALLVFLVATIVSVLMGFVGNKDWQNCWKGAAKCKEPNLITGECCDDFPSTPIYDSKSGTCVPKPVGK